MTATISTRGGDEDVVARQLVGDEEGDDGQEIEQQLHAGGDGAGGEAGYHT